MTFPRNRITVNIWDDYCDDQLIPKGERQETYAYIEDDSIELTKEEQVEVIKYLHDYVEGLKLPKVKLKIENETDLAFINFTHKQRMELLETLNKAGLTYKGISFLFFSEH